MSRPGAASLLLTVAITTLASCGVPTESSPVEFSADLEERVIVAPSTTVPDDDAAVAASLYLVRHDALAAVTRDLSPPVRAEDVIAALVRGPTPSEGRAGFRTAIPDTVLVRRVASDGDVVHVDLSSSFATIAGEEELLAIGQLVMTLTALDDVAGVTIAIDGERIAAPRADGSVTETPLLRRDFVVLVS